MNKRPGHVVVTTEVAVCTFCGRPRTLRKEEHQLGTLVRTIVTCETCHRTLSSSIGVAEVAAPADTEPAVAPVAVESQATAAKPATTPTARPAATPKAKAATKARPAGTKTKTPANRNRRSR
jgi:hypothetical protein